MGQQATRWTAGIGAVVLWFGLQMAGAHAAVSGEVTKVRGAHLEGWACDAGAPGTALQVRVLDGNGLTVANTIANEQQTGLARHEPDCGNDRHGFTIELPRAAFSCGAQALSVAAVPAAGGTPVTLSGNGPITGVVSRPPTGQIAVSAQGSAANSPLSATFAPDANGGSLSRVRWFDGATVIGETAKAPHTVQWTPRHVGEHSIHAIATDGCGVSNHATVSFTSGVVGAAVRAPSISFADPGPGRSYFTVGNLPLRLNITRQTSPLAQLRLYYATSADDPSASYQPLTVVSAPKASAYIGAWALPRPAAGTAWDGRYVLLAEVEDVAGRVGTARIELPVALPTYGQEATARFGVGPLANSNVLLATLFSIGGHGVDAAAEFVDGSGEDATVEFAPGPGENAVAQFVDAGTGEDAMKNHAGAGGAVPLKALYTVNVTAVGGGSVSGSVVAGKFTTIKFTNCATNCSASFDTNVKGSTDLTLSATPAAGNVFTGWLGAPCTGIGACAFTVAAPATITATFAPATMAPGGILPVTFDVDANLSQDALTDGLMALRFLFGLGEASIVNGALGPGAQRGGPGQPTVTGYLGAIGPVLDVDGNGAADALTDGLLINRYQFGLRGASLIAGAVGAGATRTSAAQIETYLASPCGAGIAFNSVASNAVIRHGTVVSLGATVAPTALCPIDSVVYTLGTYPGGTIIGTGATGPGYSAQWNTASVAVGTYQVTATARYGAFPVIAASANNVQINNAPSISLLTPSAGYAFGYAAAQPLTIPLRIAVTDATGVQANSVALRINGANQTLTSIGNGQWQATTAALTPGNYTVSASATNTLGTTANVTFGATGPGTAPPTFTVLNGNSAPVVALNASNVSINLGSPLTFTAATQDADGWVAQVTFATARNGVTGWSTTATNSVMANPWSPAPTATWTPAQPGTYTATATAADNVGATATSSAITVIVMQPAISCGALAASANPVVASSSFNLSTTCQVTQGSAPASYTLAWNGPGSASCATTLSNAGLLNPVSVSCTVAMPLAAASPAAYSLTVSAGANYTPATVGASVTVRAPAISCGSALGASPNPVIAGVSTLTLAATCIDDGGNPATQYSLAWSNVSAGSNCPVTATRGTAFSCAFVVPGSAPATITYGVTASAANYTAATVTAQVAVNHPPTISVVTPAQQQVIQGGSATIAVTARDLDDNPLTLQLLNGATPLAGVTVVRLDPYVPAGDNIYVLTWDTAGATPQAYPALIIKVTDNGLPGAAATQSVGVTVVGAPGSVAPDADVVYPGFYATPAVGSVPGTFAVSDSGAATYSIPIQTAPGATGMQPNLALSYNSQGGNGLLGLGWSLSGLSAVTRCAQTEAQDGSKEGINYDQASTNDRYCLDGQRLVPVGAPTAVADGSVQALRVEYRTELESYSRVESYQEAAPNSLVGPYRFRVLTRNGQQMDYGARWWIISRGYLQTGDTQNLVNRSNTAKLWVLDRVSDRHGNYMTVDYDDGDGDDTSAVSPVVKASFSPATSSLANIPELFGAFPVVQYWPTRIRYYSSGIAENAAGKFNEACFQYDLLDPAQTFFDAGAGQGTLTRRLSTIKAQTNVSDAGRVSCGVGSAVSTYYLGYEASATSGGNSRLTSVEQCGADGACLRPTTFQWNDAPKSWSTPTDSAGNPVTPQTIVSDRFHAADVNGDGRTDLIALTSHGAGSGNAYVCLSDSRGAWSCSNWSYAYLEPELNYDAVYDELYADVNGDGKADLIITNAINGKVIACPVNAQGSGFDLCAVTSGIPTRSDKVRFQADVNGDGRIDLLFYKGDQKWDVCLARSDATFACEYDFAGPEGQFGAGASDHVLLGDYNGDGRADLAQRHSTNVNDDQWKICFSNFSTPGAPSNGFDCPAADKWTSGIKGPLYSATILDFNGDGLADMAYRYFAGQWLVCLSTGDGAFQRRSDDPASTDYNNRCRTWNGVDAEFVDTLFGDFNGDGRSDMATYLGNGQFKVCLSTGTDFTCELWSRNVPLNDTVKQFLTGDLNGDGRTDIFHRQSNAATWSVAITQRVGDQIVRIANGLGAATQLAYAPLTDPGVYAKGSSASVAARELDIQSPMYVIRQTQADNGIGGVFTTSYFYEELVGRTDGRGLYGFRKHRTKDDTGIVAETEYQRVSAASYATQWPIVGRPSVARKYAPTTIPPYAANIADRVSFNGGQTLFGGQLRLVSRSTTTWEARDSTTCGAGGGMVCASVDNPQLLVKQAHPTQTVAESWEAGTVQAAGTALPAVTSMSPLWTIDDFGNPKQSSTDTGDGFPKQTINTYSNDTANWLLGRLLTAQVTLNGQAGSLTRKSAFAWHGMAGVSCAGGVPGVLCSETIEPDEATRPIAIVENGQPTALLWQKSAYEYDQYGNRVKVTTSYKDRAAEPASYNVALVDKSRKTITCYDTNSSAPSSDCYEVSGARQSYGRFPLLSKNALGHQETRTFDSRFGSPTAVTGPNGITTTSAYDGFGRKYLETVTDGAGSRLRQMFSPVEDVNTVGRCPGATPNASNCLRGVEQYRTRSAQSGGAESHAYYDVLWRELRRESKAFGNGLWVDASADYDALGRKQNSKRPAANGVVTTTLYYDSIGRVVKEAPDAGSVVCTQYNGLAVTTTRHPNSGLDCQTGTVSGNPLGSPINSGAAPVALNQTTTQIRNSRGQVAQVTDAAGGITTYRYDAHDNLLQVTPLTSATLVETLTYDRRGRKLSLQSPDSGSWAYEYNGIGELVRQSDGKNQVTRQFFDQLGRMIERREHPGSESTVPFATVWTYEGYATDPVNASTCNKGLGKLCEVRSNSVSRSGVIPGALLSLTNGGGTLPVQQRSFYDNQGRPYQSASTLAEAGGSKTYVSRSTFDANGRVDTLIYPSGYAVKHRYTGWTGQLDQVSESNAAVVHWEASTRYKDGQIGSMLVGGLTTTKTYDALGRLAGMVTSGAGATPQNASYGFDLIGNLTHRYDPAAGQADQYYGYDRLNRLTAAAATAAGLANPVSSIAQYDAAGNIFWKSGAGYYSYLPGTHRLCALGAAANPACDSGKYQYDGSGNATLWGGRTLGYTPFNAPTQILDTSSDATLSYQHDASHARIREVSTVNGTTYYLGAYEEHTRKADSVLEQRHYLNTPEGIIGLVTLRYAPANQPALPPDQARSLRYWHKDHLGSVVAIASETGALKQTFTYDPFGNRTNPVLASGEPYAEERGYTGHEHLTEVGLIHMNGRIHDPAVGRFLQADPVVQDPTGSQSYNRYSYVLNNPLSLTDPSGFSWWTTWRKPIAAIVVAVVTYGMASGAVMASYGVGETAATMTAVAGTPISTSFAASVMGSGIGGLSVGTAAGVAGGAAAGFASGGIMGGNVESAVYGAVSGGISGGVAAAVMGANPFVQVGAKAATSAALAYVQGGDWRRAGQFAGLSALTGLGWEYTRGETDKLYGASCRTKGNCIYDELDAATDGGRNTSPGFSDAELSRIRGGVKSFLDGGMSAEGSGTHMYDRGQWLCEFAGNTFCGAIRGFVRQVSKPHDWGDSWSYDKDPTSPNYGFRIEGGGYSTFGGRLAYEMGVQTWSIASMVPMAAYTAFALYGDYLNPGLYGARTER